MGTPNQLLVGITDCLKPYLEYLTFQTFEQVIGDKSFVEEVQGFKFDFTLWKEFAHGPYSLNAQDRVRKVPVSRFLNARPDDMEIVHNDILLKLTKNGGTDLHFYTMHSVFVRPSGISAAMVCDDMVMWSKYSMITDLWDDENFTELIPETFLQDSIWKDVEAWIVKSKESRVFSLKMLSDLSRKIKTDRRHR